MCFYSLCASFVAHQRATRINSKKIMHPLAVVQPLQLFISLQTAVTSLSPPFHWKATVAVYCHEFPLKDFVNQGRLKPYLRGELKRKSFLAFVYSGSPDCSNNNKTEKKKKSHVSSCLLHQSQAGANSARALIRCRPKVMKPLEEIWWRMRRLIVTKPLKRTCENDHTFIRRKEGEKNLWRLLKTFALIFFF